MCEFCNRKLPKDHECGKDYRSIIYPMQAA